MKNNTYEFPKSSFLGMAKDTSLIIDKILSNRKVLRLLYYTSPDCLEWKSDKDLNSNQIKELFETKQISNVPKVKIDKDKRTYLRITFDSFTPNATNTFYRDHIVEVKIICCIRSKRIKSNAEICFFLSINFYFRYIRNLFRFKHFFNLLRS